VPSADTIATAGLPLIHVTFWFVALVGVIAAKRVSDSPTARLADVLLRDMPVTETATLLTVTVQNAVLPPSAVVTVIVAVPALTPVTTPPVDTVTTVGLSLIHVTFWFVALVGVIATKRVSVPPTKRLVDALFSDTPVTETVTLLTVTVQNAALPPSAEVTVIIAVPSLRPVTTPPVDIVATAVSLLIHVTFWFVALVGVIATKRVSVLPTRRLVDTLFSDIPVTVTVPGVVGLLHAAKAKKTTKNAGIIQISFKMAIFKQNFTLTFIKYPLFQNGINIMYIVVFYYVIHSLSRRTNDLLILLGNKMVRHQSIFVQNLRKHRRKCGLTQAQLAEKVNVSTHHIGMIELSRNNPTLELVERIAEALNIKTYELFIDSLSPNAEFEQLRQEIKEDMRQLLDEALKKALLFQYKTSTTPSP
jgi:DNA-binding XRE family transcriptional regulator